MKPASKQTYRRFANGFLIGGGAFLAAGLARAWFAPDLLQGDPTGVALLLMAIGAGLRYTARDRPNDPEQDGDADDPG